jgi:spermidine/putrescine-binding protein
MKKNKLLLASLMMFSLVNFSSCSKNKLLILNWGEYINMDLVEAFEKENNCEVVISIAESNELFYSKVKGGTTVYDLVVPSDYMVKKMYENQLLQKIDKTRLTNYQEGMFMPGVYNIENIFINDYAFEDYSDYQIPYFWGTFGLMYNKNKIGVQEALEQYSWDCFFNKDLLPKGTKTGMYNVPRDSYAASLLHHNLSPNLIGEEYLSLVKNDLKTAKFDQWGTDELKRQVQKGDLDIAFVYTGDFLDMVYSDSNYLNVNKTLDDLTYDIYIPNNTITFMDSFVLTKNAKNVDLAYRFIDYFLDSQVAYENSSVVGYCTPIKESYEQILSLKTSSSKLDQKWASLIEKYYPLDDDNSQKSPLINFDKNYLTKVTNNVNDVKVK